MTAKKRMRLRVFIVLTVIAAMVLPMLVAVKAFAAETLSASFDSEKGFLRAVYEGNYASLEISYTWTLAESSNTKLTGATVVPTQPGTYVCTATVKPSSKETYSYTSNSVTIYKITQASANFSLNHASGLYNAGDMVRAKALLSGTQQVTGWTSTAAGLVLPTAGRAINFKMPAESFTLTCNAPAMHPIKLTGGTANAYVAFPGDNITLKASKISGKVFSKWAATGCTLTDASKAITTFTMPDNAVIIQAVFIDEAEANASSSSSSSASSSEQPSGDSDIASSEEPSSPSEELPSTDTTTASFTDPTRIVYSVGRTNQYKVDMYHAKLGPNYDAAFKLACGTDTLVTDYFSIIINDNPKIHMTPGPVTLTLTLPQDIVRTGRNFRMICITPEGFAYSFKDTDNNDATLTFTCDRFFAYAVAFNDIDYAALEAKYASEAAAAQEAAQRAQYEAGYEAGYSQGEADTKAAQPAPEPQQTASSEPASTIHSASDSKMSDPAPSTPYIPSSSPVHITNDKPLGNTSVSTGRKITL